MNNQIAMVTLAALAVGKSTTTAFMAPSSHITTSPTFYRFSSSHKCVSDGINTRKLCRLYMSSVGGNNDGNDGGGNKDSNDSSSFMDDFLDPKKASAESDNLKRAREVLSEEALPINFHNDSDNDNDNDIDIDDLYEEEGGSDIMDGIEAQDNTDTDTDTDVNVDADEKKEEIIETPGGKINLLNNPNAVDLANSPYLNVVAKLSPSDLISKFTSTAHPRVQDAVRSTILGLIGTLPKMAFETTTITTGERLASLMFQLQMTGYMFKNAEYRLSLSQSLGMAENTSNNGSTNNPNYLLDGETGDILGLSDNGTDDNDDDDDDDDDGGGSLASGKIRGKIKVRYGGKTKKDVGSDDNTTTTTDTDDNDDDEDDDESSPSMEVEVDAAAYMAELRNEVAKLREDLTATRQAKEEAIRKDLLLYIRTLPQQELNTLTNTMSNDVLGAMKGLVNVVMGGIGEGQIDKNTVTEQSGEAMAQLCMWQLVVGYNLRELEVREEMKNALMKESGDNADANSESAEDEGKNSDDDGHDDDEPSIDHEEGGFE